jgi:prepilin-type N-terminal cleavage/methylation domain-containing protein
MEDFMSTQKLKKGFTLIELMVVIVIIGILAAIAIPKLFGMSAKAKASELSPAAGTWIKLQQAYSLESTDYGATFKDIAYTPPQSKVFTFKDEGGTKTEAKWTGTNLAEKLNECPTSSTWEVKMSKDNSDNAKDQDKITTTIKGTGSKDTECEALTPSFKNLGNQTAGSSSNSGS